jgi:putative ABC transport system permease protein
VINIQPEQAEAFRTRLASAGVARYDWYPMIRGRLVSINGRPVSPDQLADDRAKRLVERRVQPQPRRGAAAAQPAGGWPLDRRRGRRAQRRGRARRDAGLKLGDTLRFDIAGRPPKGASPACARSTGARCGSTSS